MSTLVRAGINEETYYEVLKVAGSGEHNGINRALRILLDRITQLETRLEVDENDNFLVQKNENEIHKTYSTKKESNKN